MATKKIVECVPNFSEGRSPEVVDYIVAAITSVPGVFLLDREMDASHNRSVITLAGEPESVLQAVVAAVGRAAERIDLRTHRGEHPRLGAADVLPFVPIAGVTMADCVALAERAGHAIWERYRIPVYLYEEAARRPERRDLAAVRKGEFEGISREIEANPARQPDFGEPRLHPSAGAVIIGARFPLIAYNIYLNTHNLEIAKQIAKAIRQSSGGFRYVKALGFEIKERNQAQVSINLTNYEGTPLFRVFEVVKREAQRYGVAITSSEIVGLIPQKALNQCADFFLQLERFDENQILENRLMATLTDQTREIGLQEFVDSVAGGGATPGGGSVAALAGALGSALGRMVCSLTLGKKKYADVEAQVRPIAEGVDDLKTRLYRLIDEDAKAYETVMAAYSHPKSTKVEAAERQQKIEAALKRATEVPLQTAQAALEALRSIERLRPLCNQNALSDLGVGALLALSAVKGAAYNVYINLASITDSAFKSNCGAAIAKSVAEAERLAQAIERTLAF
ncbi:MAG: glutamate formimidoyltransferase [Acidobacteria bacterium]|nr:glutamate formimidoyltransferase [Acidobacteriota bacterium]MBI3658299.1 glutamate formimidoyltransferase [Acidobacteriota bacterium]